MADPPPSPKDPMTEPGPWNAVAVGYDEEFSDRLPELLDEALATLDPGPADRALDVGTGPGAIALRLARTVASVSAIDFAEQMIERLRAHLSAAGLKNVEPAVMDGHALAFDDESFDIVVSMFGWFMFSDRARALDEMRRVLRPGGRLLVTSWAPNERNSALGVAISALRETLPDLPRPAGPLPTQIPETCAREVESAGFREVTTRIVTAPMRFASVDEYLRVFERAGAPFVVLRERLGEATWGKTAERVKNILRTQYAGDVNLQAQAIYTSAIR